MTIRRHLRLLLATTSRHYGSSSLTPFQFTAADAGKLYEVPKADYERLGFNKLMPSGLIKQVTTIDECTTMIRPQLLEISSFMKTAQPSFPSLRLCLWGRFGTGKTTTLNQAVHMASSEGWIVIQLRSVLPLARKLREVEMSTYKPGRINDPFRATEILQLFKQQNSHLWKRLGDLATSKNYEWTKNDKTVEGKSITEIVEMGLSAPYLASDCVGALFRELKLHASKGDIKLFVAIDDANSLWGKTLVKKADRTFAKAHELTLVQQYKNFLQNDWSNGIILMVADQKEVSDARDPLTVPLYTPLELFGDEGFDFIDPFVPIETSIYSKEEAETIFQYYKAKRWLATPGAQSDTGRLQIAELSGYNPHYFERICAFV